MLQTLTGHRYVNRFVPTAFVLTTVSYIQYWLLFDSPSEVLTLLDIPSLLAALHRQPRNLHTLVHVLYDHLVSLLQASNDPSTAAEIDFSREVLNCVRVLSRVVPFVLRDESLEKEVFWRRERVKRSAPPSSGPSEAAEGPAGGQFVIEDDSDDEEGTNEKKKQKTPEEKRSPAEVKEEWDELEPFAPKLLRILVDLCFVPAFTVSEECRTDEGPISYVIWCAPSILTGSPSTQS